MLETTGVTSETLKEALTLPIKQGLILLDSEGCRASEKGFHYLNEILVACLPTKTA